MGRCRPEIYRAAGLCILALAGVIRPAEARQIRGASIHGTVRDSAGAPIPAVDVGVIGSGMRSRTNDLGTYRIAGLAPGAATLTARRLGYSIFSRDLHLREGEELTLDIELGARAAVLSEVEVTEPREPYDSRLAGFNARLQCHVGHFITRERIDRANNANLSQLLRELPGVRIGPSSAQGRVVRLRGANCPPLVFVDGFPASAGEFDLDMIEPASVEGVEVYSSAASVPPEFSGPRDLDRCGVIAIWSRPARPHTRAGAATDTATARGTAAVRAEAYTADEVDVAARLDSGSLRPSYPDSLYRAGVGGRVVLEFTVDTSGAVDPASVDVMASSHPLLTLAVRRALDSARFTPATRRGIRVRQVVQLPVSFIPSTVPGRGSP
jgi:TonB family protein